MCRACNGEAGPGTPAAPPDFRQRLDFPAFTKLSSVVLPDIPVSLVEQLLVPVQLILEEGLPELLLNQPLSLGRMLPVGEADFADDVVDVVHDALDNDVRSAVLRL